MEWDRGMGGLGEIVSIGERGVGPVYGRVG